MIDPHPTVGYCVYCGAIENLTDEHVIPYGMGGREILKKASCKKCAKITGSLEQRLLRGHWWPYRKLLNIRSRSGEFPKYQRVKIKRPWGESIDAQVLTDEFPIVLIFDFEPPSILNGKTVVEIPVAQKVGVKKISHAPHRALIDGQMHNLTEKDQIEFSTSNFSAADFVRFLAKIAHCHVIHARGIHACKEYFLPKYILGEGEGALTYVGGSSSKILEKDLPGNSLHAMMEVKNGDYLAVYIQLFRDGGESPTIYEVIVGKLAP